MSRPIVDVVIERLAHGGRGVGRFQGKAVFVPATAPGETVRCRIVHEKRRYAEGELLEVLQSSPQRRLPFCPIATECGGCQWQHLTYAAQLEAKQAIFNDALVRTAGVDLQLIAPILAAPDEQGYRCRAQIKCRLGKKGFLTGFYRNGTHRIVPFEHCPVLAAGLDPVLQQLRSALSRFRRADRVPQCDLCIDAAGQMLVIVHLLEGGLDELRQLLEPLTFETKVAFFVQSGRKETLRHLCGAVAQYIHPETDGVLALGFAPGGFVQVNLEQNKRLVAEALAACHLQGDERVLDLYCGIGNFSLPLARHCREVVGVEEFAPAIVVARDNARTNGLDNLQFLAQPAEAYVASCPPETFDLVLLDPPRTGASDVVAGLLRLKPRRIVYVSCDPATLARDLVPLLHGGYRFESARPVDMFPQTSHIEAVAVLSRGSVEDGDR